MAAGEVCGEQWPCVDCYTFAACHLPKGHDGDHEMTVTWARIEYAPQDPDREPSAMEQAMRRMWTPLLEHAVNMRPLPTDGTIRIVGAQTRTDPLEG